MGLSMQTSKTKIFTLFPCTGNVRQPQLDFTMVFYISLN